MSDAELTLFTASTMNGWKPLIFLEEAEIPYELKAVDFDAREQKSPEYLRINPNGRIPALVDHSRNGFVVFESGAILWYLAEKTGLFLPDAPLERSIALQWLMFQVSGVGPMMGQAMYFQRIAEPNGHRDDFAIDRYVQESRRLLEVVEGRLQGREYFLDSGYSIVDMAMYPYVRSHPWAKVDVEGLECLGAWLDRMDARPAVHRAVQMPEPRPAFFGLEPEGETEADNAARFAHDVSSS